MTFFSTPPQHLPLPWYSNICVSSLLIFNRWKERESLQDFLDLMFFFSVLSSLCLYRALCRLFRARAHHPTKSGGYKYLLPWGECISCTHQNLVSFFIKFCFDVFDTGNCETSWNVPEWILFFMVKGKNYYYNYNLY